MFVIAGRGASPLGRKFVLLIFCFCAGGRAPKGERSYVYYSWGVVRAPPAREKIRIFCFVVFEFSLLF